MERETGMLSAGLEHNGAVHREFTLRPLTVRDMIAVSEDARAKKSEYSMTVAIIARQLESLGSIGKNEITPELLENLTHADLLQIAEAGGRLAERMRSFRGTGEGVAAGGDRAS